MHLHLHLKDCLYDYGPVYSFWCYAFERFNGLLGSYHTNNKKIEPQIMRKFLTDQRARSVQLPPDLTHLDYLIPKQEDVGSLKKASCSGNEILMLYKLCSPIDPHLVDFSVSDVDALVPPIKEQVLSPFMYSSLRKMYTQLYPDSEITHLDRFYLHSRRASVGGQLFQSYNKRQSVINAYWPGTGDSFSKYDRALRRIGAIGYFLKNTVPLKRLGCDTPFKKTHILCHVQWFQYHRDHDFFGSSDIVCSTGVEVQDACCFIPLKRVCSRCAYGEMSIDFGPPTNTETVQVAIPLPIDYSI